MSNSRVMDTIKEN